MVWHRDADFPKVDLIVVPGGFSYGDYLRAGAMAAHSPAMAEVKTRAAAGVAVLGVCNGFQILTEAGLLPGALMRNASLRFVCRDVHLRVEDARAPFTGRYAEGPGASASRSPTPTATTSPTPRRSSASRARAGRCSATRRPRARSPRRPTPTARSPTSPGIRNAKGNVLGMMPHPERLADALLGGTDGRPMFEGLAEALAA